MFFEATRAAKLARIAVLAPDLFVDDLPELFDDPDFPSGPERVLLSPSGTGGGADRVLCRSWRRSRRVGVWRRILKNSAEGRLCERLQSPLTNVVTSLIARSPILFVFALFDGGSLLVAVVPAANPLQADRRVPCRIP